MFMFALTIEDTNNTVTDPYMKKVSRKSGTTSKLGKQSWTKLIT